MNQTSILQRKSESCNVYIKKEYERKIKKEGKRKKKEEREQP